MAERAGDFEWRGEDEGAEVVLYAPTDAAFGRALSAARLPGAQSPVYAAAAEEGFGWCAASTSHAAPDLVSVPAHGLLLAAEISAENIGLPLAEIPRLLTRNLSEVSPPRLGGAGVRSVCEAGARAAAENGLIEEEDLAFFDSEPEPSGADEPDALGRRALAAGERDWSLMPGEAGVYVVKEIFSTGEAERLDIGPGALVIVVGTGAGDLGRLALATHRERTLARVRAGDFGAGEDLPAAPLDSEEAADLLAAGRASGNFAGGRAALALYALRRALESFAGRLRPRAGWNVGGFEEREGLLVHRRGLARAGSGATLASGRIVGVALGAILGSAPPFGVEELDGAWPWEEAGLLGRVASLDRLESR